MFSAHKYQGLQFWDACMTQRECFLSLFSFSRNLSINYKLYENENLFTYVKIFIVTKIEIIRDS